MKAVLVRIGIDQSSKGGHWNAPVDLRSKEFVYIPIPDSDKKKYRPGLRRCYQEVMPALEVFATKHHVAVTTGLGFPRKLRDRAMHLDPDFYHLTYGDNGARQGARLNALNPGDLAVFFSSLRPIDASSELVYALVGLFVVKERLHVTDVSPDRYSENAHTRWNPISKQDIMIRGKAGLSGRLDQCIPIGEYRHGAYRLTDEMNQAWGGLDVKDGFLQRRVTPPFKEPDRFYDWFRRQNAQLLGSNH